VEAVEVVEFLPEVIAWLRQGLVPLSDELNAAPKLQITQGDIYQRLGEPPGERFDVIVIDVDHSPDDQLADTEHSFYTAKGLEKAKLHLREGGLLAVWSYAEDSSFASALRSTFASVHVEPITTFNTLVGHEQTDWLFFGMG
jgi:spermidine synthase